MVFELGMEEWNLHKTVLQLAKEMSPILGFFDPRKVVHMKKKVVHESIPNSIQLVHGTTFSGKIFTNSNCLNRKGDFKVMLMNFPLEFRQEQNRLQQSSKKL